MELLQRVWHTSRERLPFRTPGSVPQFWDLLMLQLLRPNSSNLPCLYSTFHLEYPLVLSRFCFFLVGSAFCMYCSRTLQRLVTPLILVIKFRTGSAGILIHRPLLFLPWPHQNPSFRNMFPHPIYVHAQWMKQRSVDVKQRIAPSYLHHLP